MATSRDASDPRDLMKKMRREAQREFERSEAKDTGGIEHQGPEERAPASPTSRKPPPRERERDFEAQRERDFEAQREAAREDREDRGEPKGTS